MQDGTDTTTSDGTTTGTDVPAPVPAPVEAPVEAPGKDHVHAQAASAAAARSQPVLPYACVSLQACTAHPMRGARQLPLLSCPVSIPAAAAGSKSHRAPCGACCLEISEQPILAHVLIHYILT